MKVLHCGCAMSGFESSGILSIPSKYSVDETVTRLLELLAVKGVKVFAVIDHSGEAAAIGLTMPATKVVIFGSPKAGTPLMLAAPSVAIDLPLKLLVAERAGAEGGVTIAWNSVEYLRRRHGLPEELMANVGVVEALARDAAG